MKNSTINDTLELLKKHETYLLNQIERQKNSPHLKNLELHLKEIRKKIQEKESHESNLNRIKEPLAS